MLILMEKMAKVFIFSQFEAKFGAKFEAKFARKWKFRIEKNGCWAVVTVMAFGLIQFTLVTSSGESHRYHLEQK